MQDLARIQRERDAKKKADEEARKEKQENEAILMKKRIEELNRKELEATRN